MYRLGNALNIIHVFSYSLQLISWRYFIIMVDLFIKYFIDSDASILISNSYYHEIILKWSFFSINLFYDSSLFYWFYKFSSNSVFRRILELFLEKIIVTFSIYKLLLWIIFNKKYFYILYYLLNIIWFKITYTKICNVNNVYKNIKQIYF